MAQQLPDPAAGDAWGGKRWTSTTPTSASTHPPPRPSPVPALPPPPSSSRTNPRIPPSTTASPRPRPPPPRSRIRRVSAPLPARLSPLPWEDGTRRPWTLASCCPRGSARSSSSGKSAGGQPGIKEIRKDEELRRAPLVAGVMTTCKPNGLGDLLVTLKDPTDTIAATVHKKVLLEGNNGQDISVGCVIVLSKVPVFPPTPKACYLSITRVIKVFRKDCDAPSKQVISSNTTERSEGSTNNIMMRLVGHESMMPCDTEVSLELQGPPDSSNSTSAQDSYGRCSLGNNQEGAPQMLAGDQCSKSTLNCSTGHPQQNLNIPNITCSQPSLCGSTAMFGDRHCTQSSDIENLRRPFKNEEILHGSKRLKSNALPPDGSGGTAKSRIDAANNHVLERNMNSELERNMDSELDDMAEQCASVREHVEHQQRDFIAANAGNVQPKKDVSVAFGAEWTDEQLCQLFVDY